MNQTPVFFLPEATPETQEEMYAYLANWCGCSVPDIDKRIYSITFSPDREKWTAKVGESLRGVKEVTTRSKGKDTDRTKHVSDPAIVWAIFHGTPFMVVTNHNFDPNVCSIWGNPIMAAQPSNISYFSASQS
ncbi:MAG: hypothetical protein VST69_09445 [Nitrospirota bacterium]|nr:hypothetical protein [Nitrospirota bacterium]